MKKEAALLFLFLWQTDSPIKGTFFLGTTHTPRLLWTFLTENGLVPRNARQRFAGTSLRQAVVRSTEIEGFDQSLDL